MQEEVTSIIEQYAKHDWIVRRALLSSESIAALGRYLTASFPGIEVVESRYEGLWFSRRTLPDREAWELRRLSGAPFALVAVLEDSWSHEERSGQLQATERRMFDGSHPEPMSH